ncbi:MAG: hypothetical protein EOP34_03980 [Rickettsiales bacterium]|nr:MAG: hypothetical protein EOP34_03980 [Rickettsiales bacterium]
MTVFWSLNYFIYVFKTISYEGLQLSIDKNNFISTRKIFNYIDDFMPLWQKIVSNQKGKSKQSIN